MVDQSTIRTMGWVVVAIGAVGLLSCRWFALLFARYLRLRPDPRDGSPRPTPAQRKAIATWMTAMSVFGSALIVTVGALWVAGIGTK